MKRETIEERVKKVIIDRLKVDSDEVTPESNFVTDLGADSLDVVDLVLGFEEEFNRAIPDEAAEKIKTVQDVVDYLENQLPA